MTSFLKPLPMRRFLPAVCLSVLLPLCLSVSGCSEAPKIPSAPKSESIPKDGPTAGAPAPKGEAEAPAPKPAPVDEEKNASGGEDAPGSAPAPAAEAPPPAKSKPSPGDGSVGSASPPPPAPVAPAPMPGASAPPPQSGGSSTDEGIARERGLTQSAKPPVALADKAKSYDLVPVFYGTDRTVEPDAKRLQYGTDRGHKLQLGRALVTVPTAHKVPNIERPWVVELPYFKYKIYEEKEDPAQHFTMQEIAALTKEQLLAYVKERLAKSASFKDHAFVFVHGFNTSFDAAIYRTAQIAYDLKFDGVPFVYSWPSGGKVASYTYDRGSVEQAEPLLAEFLNIVIKESGAKSISLIAHSMGNELLMRVLERIKTQVPKGVVISQVILAAPDVDRDKFTNIAREITNFAKGVTLYAASNDKALGYSARFWGGVPRAGDVPASGPLIIPGVDTIDVTAVSTDGLGLNHSGYAESKTLLNDIGLLLQTGERPPDKRVPILKKIDTSGGSFWRYPENAR
jgi:esterase/lipase superfamily enzyme